MLKEIKNKIDKLVWLWLQVTGKGTPAEMVGEIGVDRRTLQDSLKRLRSGGQIERLAHGIYCAAGRIESAASRIESAAGRIESAASRTEGGQSAAGRTLNSAASRTNSAAARTFGEGREGRYFKGEDMKGNVKGEKISVTEKMAELDRDDPIYVRRRAALQREFGYRGTSPDLLDRLAAAPSFGIDLFPETLKRWQLEISRALESEELDAGWKRLGKFVRELYEVAGYEWTPCRTPHDCAVAAAEEARRKYNAARGVVLAIEAETVCAPLKSPDELLQERERKVVERGIQDAAVASGVDLPPGERVRGRPVKSAEELAAKKAAELAAKKAKAKAQGAANVAAAKQLVAKKLVKKSA